VIAGPVDHKDGDGLNNQRANLRPATNSRNGANRLYSKPNPSSPYRGVWWAKVNKKWRSAIKVDGKYIHLGLFTDEVEAALAYDDAARKFFGEFSRPNFELSDAA
jgi:hypothetical protein